MESEPCGNHIVIRKICSQDPDCTKSIISLYSASCLRNQSLITESGGYKMREGEEKFTSTKGRGTEKVLAMLKAGHNKFW